MQMKEGCGVRILGTLELNLFGLLECDEVLCCERFICIFKHETAHKVDHRVFVLVDSEEKEGGRE